MSWLKRMVGSEQEKSVEEARNEQFSKEERRQLKQRLDLLQYQVEVIKRDFTVHQDGR